MHDTKNSSTSTNIGDVTTVTRAQLRERLLAAEFGQPDNPDIPDALRGVWENISSDVNRFLEWGREGIALGASPVIMEDWAKTFHDGARDQWAIVVNNYVDLLDKGYDPVLLSLLAELDAAGVEYEVTA